MRLPWIVLMSAVALTASSLFSLAKADAVTPKAVVERYLAMGSAMYGDAPSAAIDLQKAVDALIAAPSAKTLAAARAAWLEARPAATDLLAADFTEMADSWKEIGAARASFAERSEKDALSAILTGLGGLSYGELAGEVLDGPGAIKDKAHSDAMAYDQMIGAGNAEGNALVQAPIDTLVAQTRGIEARVSAMDLSIKVEGSDGLDQPGAVQKVSR